LAPDSNDKEEAKHLWEVSTTWKMQIAQAKAAKVTVEFCLRQILMPKLTYALIAIDFTKQQCNDIMKLALNQALPAMGIRRHFPWVVVHHPVGHQGLALPILCTKQVCIHLITMIRFGHQWEDPTGQLLRANAEGFRLEVGLSGPIFNLPIIIEPYLMDSWLMSSWNQSRIVDIAITTDIQDVRPLKQNDKELM